MNYNRGPMLGGNPRVKKGTSYIVKLSRQLTGVLIIILVLMMFKYSKTDVSEKFSKIIVDNFYLDYTKKVVEVYNQYSPAVQDTVETFVNNVGK
ncbi:MAG: hypothetical protein RSA01_04415 [Clostridium sp.]|uniref:hypothetical protein n=1 Tax=Clostridium sp. TaxID=1506 RepID=UPI002FC62794